MCSKTDLGNFQYEGQVGWTGMSNDSYYRGLPCVLDNSQSNQRANENAASLATPPEILNWGIWGWSQII